MRKINYIASWENNKIKTWSGTTYSLMKSLEKYVDVVDMDISLNLYEKILCKIVSRAKNEKVFGKLTYYLHSYKIKKFAQKNNEAINIYIGDSGEIINGGYIYQDLSIESLIFYKKYNNKSYEFSGFQNASEEELAWRLIKQKKNYENLDGIFTMSKWLANNLVNYSKIPSEKVHYVGAGINLDKNKIDSSNKCGNKILFVGRDFERKGGFLTVEAFKLLKKEMSEVELYIVGPKKNPLDKEYEGIYYIGDISSKELSVYFNKCDIFCLPSKFEAFGLVFIEALVYGLPCIGRNDFEMKEFITDGENGYLLKDDNPKVLCNVMRKLLMDNNCSINVINNRDYYLEKYSWDKVASRMLDIIKENNN